MIKCTIQTYKALYEFKLDLKDSQEAILAKKLCKIYEVSTENAKNIQEANFLTACSSQKKVNNVALKR